MKAIRRKLFYIFILAMMLMSSCKKEDNPISSDDSNLITGANISTGTSVTVTTQNIGQSGGIIKVVSAGSPVNGLEINVPQNAFTESRTFAISYSTIQSHKFGSNFNPVSPLINIKNGGGFSSSPMTIKIPMKKAKDEFALGFFYNEVTGKLEGLPIVAESDSTVTISISHLATSSLSLGKKLYKGQLDQTAQGNLVVTSIKESVLNSQAIINTGFTPGVDDWEFINYGSYIAPGGHCAGQSMTAMWYFYEKKLKGENSLFHKFDNICDASKPGTLWQDDPKGYRFASTIQEDFNWDGWITKVDIQSYVPSLIWKTFIAAMLITGEPQFVIIKNSTSGVGHAMIVYKINLSENKLYIADPNYPNNKSPNGTSSVRTINYNNGSFEPYSSALNANSSQILFDQIAYFGKTANINWSQIATRWNEFQNNTIGNDRFPKYDLYVKGTTPTTLQDGMIRYKDTLQVYCKSTQCLQYISGTDNLQVINIFDENGNYVTKGDFPEKGIATIKLKSGKNKFGIYVMGSRDNKDYYLDFKWFTVTYVPLAITSITPTSGDAGINVTIKGTGFQPTRGNSYVQFNGIGTTDISSWSDTLITVKVPQNATTGDITVVVDGKTSNGIKFTVTTPVNLNGLDKTTKIQLGIEGTTVLGTQTNITSVTIANTDGFSTVGYFAWPECPLQWNGNTFNVKGVHIRSTYQRDSVYISGTVSNDGKTIISVDAAYRYYSVSASDGSLTEEEKYSFTLTNVPSYVFIAGNYSFLTMSSPASKISNFKWSRWIKGNPLETGSFTSVLYIHVDFN